MCSNELKSVILPNACIPRSTRFAHSQHIVDVKLEKYRNTSYIQYACPHVLFLRKAQFIVHRPKSFSKCCKTNKKKK